MKKDFTMFSYSFKGTVSKKVLFFRKVLPYQGHGVFCVPHHKVDAFIRSPYTSLTELVLVETKAKGFVLEQVYFTSLSRLGYTDTALSGENTVSVPIGKIHE